MFHNKAINENTSTALESLKFDIKLKSLEVLIIDNLTIFKLKA